MKKSDEQQNEELRRLLSGTFDEFGREPSNGTWSRIRAVIPSREPWYARLPVRRSAVLLLLSGLMVSSWLVFQHVEKTRPDRALRLSSAEKSIQSQPRARQLSAYGIERGNKLPTSAEPVLMPEGRLKGKEEPSLDAERTKLPFESERLIQKKTNPKSRIVSATATGEQMSRRITDDAYMTKEKRNRIDRTGLTVSTSVERASRNSDEGTAQLESGQSGRTLEFIHELTARPVSFVQLPLLPSSIDWKVETAPVIRKNRTDWRLTGDVMPLYTYQLLTTRNVPEAYVQNFQTPSAFSGQMAGFNLALGLAQAQWKAQLTFTRMKRWAYYEIATNEYQVVPVDQDRSLVIRQGIPVAESTTLSLVGLRISREYKLFDKGNWQFLVNAGGEGAWSFTTQQGLLFASSSVVAACNLSDQLRLRVAPALDFGLTPLRDAKNLLHIRPYNVGVRVGIETRLVRKK